MQYTPVWGGGADWEKQPRSFEQCTSFPSGKPAGAPSGFNIEAIYTVLSVWAGGKMLLHVEHLDILYEPVDILL